MSSTKDIESPKKKDEGTSFAGMVFPERGILADIHEPASDRLFESEPAPEEGWTHAGAMKYMVGHAPEAFWQMNRELKFTYTNSACEKISGGFRAEDFVGRSLLEFLTPEGIENLRSLHTARQSEEKRGIQTDVLFYELQMRRRDGSYFWAGISSTPMRDKDGQIIGYQGIMRDISLFKQNQVERERLEGLLKKTEKMAAIGHMAGSVAHELNNMMAGILGYSELLMLQCDPDDVSHAHLQSIIGNGERAAAILQDVLILSLGEAGGRKPVNLNDLIVAFLEKPEFQSITKRREESSVRMDLEMSLHDVFASAAKLEKAVASLLYISFARAGAQGAVSIATKTLHLGRPAGGDDNICEGEYVVLSVTDSGDGIPDEFASHLFEPFYVKKVMRHGVTGLELPIVREVVKEHDGFIDVHSKTGSGTTFTVYLPVSHGKPRVGRHPMSPDFPDAPASMN